MQTLEKENKYNLIRAAKISSAARQNDMFSSDVSEYLLHNENNISKQEINSLLRFRKSIDSCSRLGLFRENEAKKTFIAAHTCKHKFCAVCNYNRSKTVRRKYRAFLENDFLIKETFNKKTSETITKTYEKKKIDFMHLTLTVPHKDGLFKGKTWYAPDLVKYFNIMRKQEFWKILVIGGEYGIETTKGANGLHIHIHSLLMVNNEKGSRNWLHKEIFLFWNKITAIKKSKKLIALEKNKIKLEYTDSEKLELEIIKKSFLENMKKGNKTFEQEDLEKIDSTGSTMIGLETIYCFLKKKVSVKDIWIEEKKRWKHHIISTDPDSMRMNAILECIKYHFEPIALLNEDKHLNVDFVKEALPHIAGKPLYRKFGFLHGLKSLNVNYKKEEIKDEILDAIKEMQKPQDFIKEDSIYFLTDCRKFFVKDENLIFTDKNHIINMVSRKINSAIYEMMSISLEKMKSNRALNKKNFDFKNNVAELKQRNEREILRELKQRNKKELEDFRKWEKDFFG